MKCVDCNREIPRINPKQKRCRDCQVVHRLELARKYWHERKQKPVNEYVKLLNSLTKE